MTDIPATVARISPDVRALVGNPLHVGNDLQGGGDHPQIPGQGLLQGQQVHTALLDAFFHGVDLDVLLKNALGHGHVHIFQGADGALHDAVDAPAHLGQIGVQPRQLLVEYISRHGLNRPFLCQPNRPVM